MVMAWLNSVKQMKLQDVDEIGCWSFKFKEWDVAKTANINNNWLLGLPYSDDSSNGFVLWFK